MIESADRTTQPSEAIASPAPTSERVAAARSAATPFEGGAELVLVLDARARLLHASAGFAAILGAAPVALAGRSAFELIESSRLEKEQREVFALGLASALRHRRAAEPLLSLDDSESGTRIFEGRVYADCPDPGDVLLAFHDVTERWFRLNALAESERRFSMVAEATRDMITETDSRGRFTYVSSACTQVLGFSAEELLSRSPLRIHHPDDRKQFLETLDGQREPGRPFRVAPHRLRRSDGSWVWVEATGVRYRRPDGELRLIGVARDITPGIEAARARRDLEEQVRRSQRLESLGILAGGLAHDFNNLLTPIVASASLLLDELPEASPIRKRVRAIRMAGDRATALTRQMLTFAGRSEVAFEIIDASEAIREMSLLLESTASRQVSLEYRLADELPQIRADKAQIGQLVLNLVANAAEAFGPEGGRVELHTRVIDADRELLGSCYLGGERAAGRYVCIEVRDDGAGIDADMRERIFDPFYTTKVSGRGLGLAVVLGIVRGHEGALQIESEPGRGASFRILLPTVQTSCGAHPVESAEARVESLEPAAVGELLVVDDDEGTRDLARIVLERAGFSVRSAASGPEAIELFRAHAGQLAGVVLDSTMPEMSGARVFEQIRAIDPTARVLLISGYAREDVADELLERGLVGFLHKPFDAERLIEAVGRLVAREIQPT